MMKTLVLTFLLAACNSRATQWDVTPSDATGGCQLTANSTPEADFACWDDPDGGPVSCFYGPDSFAECMLDPTRPASAGCH